MCAATTMLQKPETLFSSCLQRWRRTRLFFNHIHPMKMEIYHQELNYFRMFARNHWISTLGISWGRSILEGLYRLGVGLYRAVCFTTTIYCYYYYCMGFAQHRPCRSKKWTEKGRDIDPFSAPCWGKLCLA